MNMNEVKKQSYTLFENQPAMVVTDIDFTDVTSEQMKEFSSLNEVLSSPFVRTKRLSPEYIDEEPTYDIYLGYKLIKRDMSLSDVEHFFKIK